MHTGRVAVIYTTLLIVKFGKVVVEFMKASDTTLLHPKSVKAFEQFSPYFETTKRSPDLNYLGLIGRSWRGTKVSGTYFRDPLQTQENKMLNHWCTCIHGYIETSNDVTSNNFSCLTMLLQAQFITLNFISPGKETH